jgi:hypothetical protein
MKYIALRLYSIPRGRHGCDHMVVGFMTTYAIRFTDNIWGKNDYEILLRSSKCPFFISRHDVPIFI